MLNNTNEVVETKHYDDSHSRSFKERTVKQLTEEVKNTSKRDAEENLPEVKGDELHHYLDPHMGGVQLMVIGLRDIHRDESVADTVAMRDKECQQERNNRDDLKTQVQDHVNQLKSVVQSMPGKIAVGFAVSVILLGLMEGGMSISALRVLIPFLGLATIISVIFGLGWAILAHEFPSLWRSGKTKLGRLLRRFLLITGISLVFIFIGALRSYRNQVANTSVDDVVSGGIFQIADPQEALLYMVLSWAVMIPAIILAKHGPNKEEFLAIFRKRNLEKKLKAKQEDLASSEAEIKKLSTKIDNLKIWEKSRNTCAAKDEEEALHLIDYLRSIYIQTNLRHRTDRKKPDAFEKPFTYPLTLYFQKPETRRTSSQHPPKKN